MPIASTTPPAGAKSFSPTKAAQRTSVTTSFGSSDRSALSPRTVSNTPPPTQNTDTATWTSLKNAYQCDGTEVALNAKTTPTTRPTRPMGGVGGGGERRSPGGAAVV